MPQCLPLAEPRQSPPVARMCWAAAHHTRPMPRARLPAQAAAQQLPNPNLGPAGIAPCPPEWQLLTRVTLGATRGMRPFQLRVPRHICIQSFGGSLPIYACELLYLYMHIYIYIYIYRDDIYIYIYVCMCVHVPAYARAFVLTRSRSGPAIYLA